MLRRSQEKAIEQVTTRLTAESPLFNEGVDRGTYARNELLHISGRRVIQLEWGSILPDPEVSLEFLARLTDVSPAMARLSFRRSLTVDDTWGCWSLPLLREQDSKGRGKYPLVTDKANGALSMVAHRYVWKTLIDPDIPSNDYLDHLCRVHACCNIAHLEPVSSSLNTKRGNDARHIISGQGALFHPE